jgi:hypothetical protein
MDEWICGVGARCVDEGRTLALHDKSKPVKANQTQSNQKNREKKRHAGCRESPFGSFLISGVSKKWAAPNPGGRHLCRLEESTACS